MQHAGETTTPIQSTVLFGTVNGAVGKFVHAVHCKDVWRVALCVKENENG